MIDQFLIIYNSIVKPALESFSPSPVILIGWLFYWN